jgi:hypothetical protein
MNKDTQAHKKTQVRLGYSAYLEERCYQALSGFLAYLDFQLDRRLVQTFFALVLVIVLHRHRNQGLLLSELGGFFLSGEQAPAGTKRISRLLHSSKWASEMIADYLWLQADQRVEALTQAGKRVLVVWDESELEKPESLKLEGLCAVRSSKAHRLKRIKPGYYNSPGGRPIFVPGYHWLQVLVLGMEGAPKVAHLGWWTSRGEGAQDKRSVEREILAEAAHRWGAQVLHVWDRGFAGGPWLSLAQVYAVRFVLRWPKKYQLRDENETVRKAWEITRGKRSWDHRQIWDARRRCYRKVGIVAVPVFDREHSQPLWLVVARPGAGREPWYLLTNEPAHTPELAWRVVLAYARRWQVEISIRYDKSELAF